MTRYIIARVPVGVDQTHVDKQAGEHRDQQQVLIDALRRDVPITAIIKGFDGSLMPAEYDALCEALSYVSFIFTDSSSAEIFLKEPTFNPEEMLRTIHKRFGVLSVILTDEGLAFDGERITEFTEE